MTTKLSQSIEVEIAKAKEKINRLKIDNYDTLVKRVKQLEAQIEALTKQLHQLEEVKK